MRKNSKSYRLLRYLALGSGVLVVSALAPASGAQIVHAAIAGYFRKKRFERNRFLQDLKRLQDRRLVSWREHPDGRIEIVLTQQGKNKTLAFKLDELKLTAPQRWDGKWRLVMFDIPKDHKFARDAFRKKLRDLKFYPMQKSVFLTPYPCEDEIDFLAMVFEVREHVLLLRVSRFEGEEKLRHHFQLD
ncbi:MAG: hypothetical protein HY978_00680 [Candidatus Liptonbacteria bacterium]|nr:hypothetical protein [Candidatus Liptonbacteria bacterium]